VFKPETAARTFSRRGLHGQAARTIGGRIIGEKLVPGAMREFHRVVDEADETGS
jgi:hypothetical protein